MLVVALVCALLALAAWVSQPSPPEDGCQSSHSDRVCSGPMR